MDLHPASTGQRCRYYAQINFWINVQALCPSLAGKCQGHANECSGVARCWGFGRDCVIAN